MHVKIEYHVTLLSDNCSESANSEVSESFVDLEVHESLVDDGVTESPLNNCDSELETPGSTL